MMKTPDKTGAQVSDVPQLSPPGPRSAEALPQNEEIFRLLVESVQDYAIFMLDPQGYVATWNAGAERIKGYKAHEILGEHFSRFYPGDAVAAGWPAHELRLARAQGRFEDEGWRIRKDGTAFWASVIITAVHDQTGTLRGFAKVTRDMTERKRLQALALGEQRMTVFLAMLAHELRNPLAPIRNAVAVMQMHPSADAQLQWTASVIDRQVSHLARLVDDLLDISRITSGKIVLQERPLELVAVVNDAVEASQPLISARHHTLRIELPSEALWIHGDATRLSQVLMNLLNNAAKFTPEGGKLRLTASRDGATAVIRVVDTGVGIAAELLPKIFDLFTQADRTLARSQGGLGIGLTLARRLVELHGGAIEAYSRGPGQGSEFVVRLPLRRDHLSAETNPAPEAEDLAPTQPRRVLVVDDHRDAAQVLTVMLRTWGHDTCQAHDGPSALTVAADYLPDVVLLDIGLPKLSGNAVARRLRELPGLRKVVIIAVTGYGQERESAAMRLAGFDDYLVKPADPSRLRQLIAAAPARSN